MVHFSAYDDVVAVVEINEEVVVDDDVAVVVDDINVD
jgi:hypothetical protein